MLRQKGYTLPEISVVLLLSSLFALSAVPALLQSVDESQLAMRTQSVKQLIEHARILGLNNSSAQVCSAGPKGCDASWGTNELLLQVRDQASVGSTAYRQLERLPVPDLRMVWRGLRTKVPIEFSPTGSNNGSLYLCPSGGQTAMRILISRHGRPRIEECPACAFCAK